MSDPISLVRVVNQLSFLELVLGVALGVAAGGFMLVVVAIQLG